MELKRVVVTGLGAVTPLGNTIPDFWNSITNGVSGAGPITRFDASAFKTQFACEVKDFNPGDLFDRKEARKFDRYSQFAVKAASSGLIDKKDADLDSYVTQKAMDGLFLMIAEEEKKLRSNPVGAGSDLLKKVFGAL